MFAAAVVILSGILVGLFALWASSPDFRTWIEAPKSVFLHQEERFENASSQSTRPDVKGNVDAVSTPSANLAP